MNELFYSIFMLKDKDYYVVYIPDFDGYTEGRSVKDAIEMAKDYINLSIVDCKEKIPKESSYEKCIKKLESNPDLSDFLNGIHTIVEINIEKYRASLEKKTIRRNVSLPQYLNDFANKLNINVSKLLTDSLEKKYTCSIKLPTKQSTSRHYKSK